MKGTNDLGNHSDGPLRAWASPGSRWAAPLAARIRTGCVFESQPAGSFGLLVTRADPRPRRRVRAPIQAHWSLLAPSVPLLMGLPVTPVAEQAHRWPAFAATYHAELAAQPFHVHLAVARQVAAWLREYETVTILSFEHWSPRAYAPDYWAQRHVFRDWLRALLPLAQPLSVSARS